MAHVLHHGKNGRLPTGHTGSSARVIGCVKHALALLLLLGAIVGLLGVQTAAATTPVPMMTPAMPTHAEMGAMPADCMTKMSEHAPSNKQPCTGITLDCIAAMGCAMPFVSANVTLGVRTAIAAPKPSRSIALALVGNDLAPEPEPPTILS